MVSSLAVLVGLRLAEDVDFLTVERSNAELFIKLTRQRVRGRFACFTVPSDDVPDTGIKSTVLLGNYRKRPANTGVNTKSSAGSSTGISWHDATKFGRGD